ncbi:putative mitochondrial protein, partial [Mucuna pruriens]
MSPDSFSVAFALLDSSWVPGLDKFVAVIRAHSHPYFDLLHLSFEANIDGLDFFLVGKGGWDNTGCMDPRSTQQAAVRKVSLGKTFREEPLSNSTRVNKWPKHLTDMLRALLCPLPSIGISSSKMKGRHSSIAEMSSLITDKSFRHTEPEKNIGLQEIHNHFYCLYPLRNSPPGAERRKCRTERNLASEMHLRMCLTGIWKQQGKCICQQTMANSGPSTKVVHQGSRLKLALSRLFLFIWAESMVQDAFCKHVSKVSAYTVKSSIKTSMHSSNKSKKMLSIHLRNVLRALQSPNDILTCQQKTWMGQLRLAKRSSIMDGSTRTRRCIPDAKFLSILHFCLSTPGDGYYGSTRTSRKVLNCGFYWPTIYRDAYKFVSAYKQCQRARMAISRRNEMPQQPILSYEIFYVWGIDFMGLFLISNGYSYILLVVDYAIATRTNDAKVVVDFLYYRNWRSYAWRPMRTPVSINRSQILRKEFKVDQKKLIASKLRSRWDGPFVITNIFPYGVVELRVEASNKIFQANGHQLKHFHESPTQVLGEVETNTLHREQKEKLLKVLRQHKKLIRWKLSDLPRINPSICTHRILMEEEAHPIRQQQRRLNPSILDVVKKELVYGFNPLIHLDLLPLLDVASRLNEDQLSKAQFVKKLHERARSHIEKKVGQYAKQANRGRKEKAFERRDLVCVHLRKERFPKLRQSKLLLRGDGPFKILKRVNDNSYIVIYPKSMGIYLTTTNFEDKFFSKKESDAYMGEHTQGYQRGMNEEVNPTLGGPMTRGRLKRIQGQAQSYELKSGLIHLLPKFHGLAGEDPHKHLKEFPL